MSRYLLSISIGPVQDFIVAARRTRDFWYGSWLLSEISKAAANELDAVGAELIFPASLTNNDLLPDSDFTATNKILAIIPENILPEDAFQRAEKAAIDRFFSEADKVFEQICKYINPERWENQIRDILEIYGAWVPEEGIMSRKLVERLLAGRKALRNFEQGQGEPRIPKSSLDGLRESVLKSKPHDSHLPMLKIRPGEQLDSIGFIKRLGGGTKSYPSVARVALDPWVRKVASDNSLKTKKAFEELIKISSHISSLPQIREPQYSLFPYEGTVCYVSRHEEVFSRENVSLKSRIQQVLSDLPTPSPYMGVLMADGDKMGAALDSLNSFAEIKEVSLALSEFAKEAKKVITNHYGCLVYAGGDDVLAFVPLDKCLIIARDLYDLFGNIVGNKIKMEKTTLSVGIAICHFLEPLGDILQRARLAEKEAKSPDRNGLAISLYKRSGGAALSFRSSWEKNPDQDIEAWLELFASNQLPSKAAYELYELADFYQRSKEIELPIEALEKDALRILERKDIKKSAVPIVEKLLLQSIKNADEFKSRVEVMLFAEHLSQALIAKDGR
mgnify:CR=1 FL=1